MFFFGCLFTALAITLQAFGHHALQPFLDAKQLTIFETASRYLMWGSIWMLTFGNASKYTTISRLGLALIFIGLGLFCGSLLIYLVWPIRWLMIITPLGGAFMICGFIRCAFPGKVETSKLL